MLKLFRSLLLTLVALALISTSACQPSDTTLAYSGKTMGTTFNVVAVLPSATPPEEVEKAIDVSLARVNSHLSNWDPKSEISRFNAVRHANPVVVSKMMAEVMSAANEVNRDSEGYFDVTLAPLIELWGFGTRKTEGLVPHERDIELARSKAGQSTKLMLDDGSRTLTKRDENVTVNLSALAKGFGVDEVAKTLRKFGIKNYMVEIGGDLVTSGRNARGKKWRIGIEKPEPNGRSIQLTIDVSGMGLATSGDYRNYREHNGVRYSHIIDANKGRPITHKTASVTVLAKSAMMADAWATALLAMGKEDGMRVAKKHNLAAVFIYRTKDQDVAQGKNSFDTLMSPRFADIKTGN